MMRARLKYVVVCVVITVFFVLIPKQKTQEWYVCADLEGRWALWETFVNKCNGALTVTPLSDDICNITLQDGAGVVLLGDSIDHGMQNKKLLTCLLSLKDTYKERVVFILGNRDINKLRCLFELAPSALVLNGDDRYALDKFRLHHWENRFAQWLKNGITLDGKPAFYTHGKNPDADTILKFKWMLSCTMGAEYSFENFKKEINAATDFQAYTQYQEVMVPMIIRYMQSAHMVYVDENTKTMFVHGGLTSESFGYIPETRLGKGDFHKIVIQDKESLNAWVTGLNQWTQNRLNDALQGDILGAMPLIQYPEDEVKVIDGKQVVSKFINPISVIRGTRVYSRTEDNLVCLNPTIADMLKQIGIERLVVGHSPVGQVPVLLKNSGFITVACDTSFSNPPCNAAVVVSADGVTVHADYHDYDGSVYDITYSSQDPLVGTHFIRDGHINWVIASLENSKMLVGFWIRSLKGAWCDSYYTIYAAAH